MSDQGQQTTPAGGWADPTSSPSQPSDKPLPSVPPYRSSSFASTSSLTNSMRSAGSSATGAIAKPPSPSLGVFGQSLFANGAVAPERRSSTASVNPQINTILKPHHSCPASFQSSWSRCSSHTSCSDEAEADTIYRAPSPVSIATTFGGRPRYNDRSRSTTAERSPPPSAHSHLPPRRLSRPDSLVSEASGRSSFSSEYSPRRMSLPPNTSRYSAITPELEGDDPFATADWSTWSSNAARERAAEYEMRSAPGVRGVGEGWAGGPSSKTKGKRGGWFRRKGRNRAMAGPSDPLALWTVPEEPRISPLKSAWNKSRARFGASVPVLALSRSGGKAEKGSGLKLGQKARSLFSASMADLRAAARRGNDSSIGGVTNDGGLSRGTAASFRSTRLPPISERTINVRVQSQPHLPLPRSTSLLNLSIPPLRIPSPIILSPPLSWVDTFGGDERVAAPSESRSSAGNTTQSNHCPFSSCPPSPSPSPSQAGFGRRTSLRRTLTTKIKSRWTTVTSSILPRSSADASAERSTTTTPSTPSPSPTPPATRSDSANSRLRPIANLPAAFESPPLTRPSPPSSSRPSDLRTLVHKLGVRQLSTRRDIVPVEDGEELFAKQRRRKSFSASFQDLTRWSKSEGNLLRFKKSGSNESLGDLLARLKEVRVPEGGVSEDREGDRAATLAATERKLSGNELTTTPTRPPLQPILVDSSPTKFGTSSINTSRSGSTTAHTPSLLTPSKLDIVLTPAVEIEADQPPASAQFPWAAQQRRKWRRSSRSEESMDFKAARRWLMGSRPSSANSGSVRG